RHQNHRRLPVGRPFVSELVRLAVTDGIAVIEIDNPPVNATSHGMRVGLKVAVEQAAADPAVRGIVIAAAGRTFGAGAGLRDKGRPPVAPILPEGCTLIEQCPKPVVAAIHGSALGGGFELALAAHARVIAPDARVGLPEVTLGIIPGSGGTQRTPRLAGIPAAFDLITSGKPVDAEKALALGLVHQIASDLPPAALALAL